MLIESLARKQACLFTALPLVLEYTLNASLQALGEHQKFRCHALIGVNQFLINVCHAIYLYTDVAMCIPVRDAICLLLQLFRQFFLHCFMDTAFCHFLQNAFNILCSMLIAIAGILGVHGDTAFTLPFSQGRYMRGNAIRFFSQYPLHLCSERLCLAAIRNEITGRRHRRSR